MKKHLVAIILIAVLILPALKSENILSMVHNNYLGNLELHNLDGDNSTAGIMQANSTISTKNLDFENLLKYVQNLRGNFSEFPLRTTEDGYINATYFGILASYLLGIIEDIQGQNKLSRFLEYLYDEETGGFRDWLDGKVSIQSTMYAILTMNLTEQYFPEFNATKTANFVLSRVINGGFAEVNRSYADPYTTAIAIITLKYLETQVNKSRLISNIDFYSGVNYIIDKFDKTHGFYDEKVDLPATIQNYWALKAILVVDKGSLSPIKEDIVKIFLSYLYKGERGSLLGGFGSLGDNPTVFETGICIDALRSLDYSNETLFELAIRFINNSQSVSGEIYENPYSKIGDIFQATGALLTYYATGKMREAINVENYIIPSEQVPIDYDNLQIKLRLKIIENDLDFLNITYEFREKNIGGELAFDGVSYYYLNILPSILGFGNFTVFFYVYLPQTIYTTKLMSYELNFRVGYNLVTEINATEYKPSQTLSLEVNVTFGKNNTIIDQGELIINLTNINNVLVTGDRFSLSGSPIVYNWTIPSDFALGKYFIVLCVNDTHGYNHTLKKIEFTILDKLNITLTNDLPQKYYPGTLINSSIEVRYNYSSALIPQIPKVEVSIKNGTYEFLEKQLEWINIGLLNLTVELPTVIPQNNNLTMFLRFSWPGGIEQIVSLGNITIYLGSITVGKIQNLLETYLYGENFTFELDLLVKETNKILKNATLMTQLTNGSNIPQSFYLKYNSDNMLYEANQKIDPNIPQGSYFLAFKVYVPYNASYVDLISDEEYIVNVNGTLKGELIRISGELLEGEVISIRFKVTCLENNKLINGLNLIANATSKKFNASSIVTDMGYGEYILMFRSLKAGKYSVNVYRVSDEYEVMSFELNIQKKETETAAFFEMYGPAISVGVIISLILLYIVASWWFGGKISRRYLIRKLKRK